MNEPREMNIRRLVLTDVGWQAQEHFPELSAPHRERRDIWPVIVSLFAIGVVAWVELALPAGGRAGETSRQVSAVTSENVAQRRATTQGTVGLRGSSTPSASANRGGHAPEPRSEGLEPYLLVFDDAIRGVNAVDLINTPEPLRRAHAALAAASRVGLEGSRAREYAATFERECRRVGIKALEVGDIVLALEVIDLGLSISPQSPHLRQLRNDAARRLRLQDALELKPR